MNLELFIRRAHTAYAESLGYNVNLFNEASDGAIIIGTEKSGQMAGGYSEESFFAYVDGLIRRRDPSGNAALNLKQLANKKDNAIRLAFTTEQLDLSEHWWDWIGRDNALAAATFGKMLSEQTLQGYVTRAVSVLKATVGSNANTFRDATLQAVEENKKMSYKNLILTGDLMGDRADSLNTWIMPRSSRTSLLIDNLKNANSLFNFGTVNVMQDVEGRRIITSDDPSLRDVDQVTSDVSNWAFGLRRGAIIMRELGDFEDLTEKTGGTENIKKTYQAQWSTLLNVMGYKYKLDALQDSTYASPSDAAIATPANWSQVTHTHKETAGVALKVKHIIE